MSKKKPPDLARMIIARQAEKNYYLRRWGIVAKSYDITQAEIDYWLLFIVDNFLPSESRRKLYIVDWNVREKILRHKHAGKWPLPVERNHHFLDMFKKAYHFPP